MLKKVLIITYYWPPAGGIAVQRWVKFAKYLREYDWEPVIYTVSNGNYRLLDHSKSNETPAGTQIIKRPIWEPHHLYHFFSRTKHSSGGRDYIKSKETISFIQRVSIWFRGNFFIPDARAMWIKPSIKFLSKYLTENSVDAIVSTGPPHSMHRIAYGLKKKLNLPWLADFRDPWTTMDYYKDLMLTSWANRRHHKLELEVLQTADAVVVVGNSMKKEFEAKRKSPVNLITNGYDESDFANHKTIKPDAEFSIVHIGSLYQRRNPVALWRAMAELKKENHRCMDFLKVKLIGKVDPDILDHVRSVGLESYIEWIDHLPHQEAVAAMMSARVLLLPIDNFDGAQWVLTGKLFEYLAAARPILCIGPVDGDAAQVIKSANAGATFNFNDARGIKNYLIELYLRFQQNELQLTAGTNQMYSHRNLTRQVAVILNRITQKQHA
ncbi:MAG: glycosyl transferase family 1 [Bacteroidetes bacterium]|nr:glycosyl transferase family 1 [Bacteroidota bacterium]